MSDKEKFSCPSTKEFEDLEEMIDLSSQASTEEEIAKLGEEQLLNVSTRDLDVSFEEKELEISSEEAMLNISSEIEPLEPAEKKELESVAEKVSNISVGKKSPKVRDSGKLSVAPTEVIASDEKLEGTDEDEILILTEEELLEVPVGGKISDDGKPSEVPSKVKSLEKRPPRLNRRGFQQSAISKEVEPAAVNIHAASKTKPEVPGRKVISLASVKKNWKESKQMQEKGEKKEKRTLSKNDFDQKPETSQAQPKKKHKPITWP